MLPVIKCLLYLSPLKGAYDDFFDIINGDKLSSKLEKELRW
jgi:hypothetical protein